MRKVIVFLAFIAAVSATSAHASHVDFNIGVNLGPLPVPAVPVYATPPVVAAGPEFVPLPGAGFYAAVGVPYDLFRVGRRYYLCRDNTWYSAPYYNGPWIAVGYRSLPSPLRRYPVERVRYWRDERQRHYGDEGDRYYRPGREWREGRWHGRDDWGRERSRWSGDE
jgi:hypothetical protein